MAKKTETKSTKKKTVEIPDTATGETVVGDETTNKKTKKTTAEKTNTESDVIDKKTTRKSRVKTDKTKVTVDTKEQEITQNTAENKEIEIPSQLKRHGLSNIFSKIFKKINS